MLRGFSQLLPWLAFVSAGPQRLASEHDMVPTWARRAVACATVSVALLGSARTGVRAQATIDVDEIIIYTKIAAPFSMPYGPPVDGQYPSIQPEGLSGEAEAQGYTIDYILAQDGLLAQVDPELRDLVTVKMLGGNQEIFHQVGNTTECDPEANPRRLCIGAAAISITVGREEYTGGGDPRLDFLPSYFMAGLRIMTRTDAGVMTVLGGVLLKGGAIVLSVIIILASVMLVFAPIMWIFEAYFTPPDLISIFHCADAVMMDMSEERFDDQIDENDRVEISEAKRFQSEMFNALMWTVTLFAGGTPGKPASLPGRIVRTAGLALNRVLQVAIISAVTTVMTLGFKATGIKECATTRVHT